MSAVASPPAVGADLKKLLKPLLNPPREPVLVDVPELNYLAVDGRGSPEAAAGAATDFQRAIQTIYPIVYTLKFRLKPEGIAVPIMPLEALWFTGDGETFDVDVDATQWGWRVIMAVPDMITPELVADALAEARRKKPGAAPAELRVERWREGLSAQVMHVGPYSEERPTIERLHAFIAARGFVKRGPHHEIYIGDPRNADQSKLKTVVRQPVAAA